MNKGNAVFSKNNRCRGFFSDMNFRSIVAGSILSLDLSDLRQEILKFQGWGLDVFHIDVMDGHFVPNLTFGPPVFAGLKGEVKIPVDIHLMVLNPLEYLDQFAEIFNNGEFESGKNWFGIHIELYLDEKGVLDGERLGHDLQKIRMAGFLTTVVFNPDTDIELIKDFMFSDMESCLVDKVLIMTVWPGFSGQEMIVKTLDKVKYCRDNFARLGCLVAVDGGVNDINIKQVLQSGADFVVSGSYLMAEKNKDSFKQKFLGLKA